MEHHLGHRHNYRVKVRADFLCLVVRVFVCGVRTGLFPVVIGMHLEIPARHGHQQQKNSNDGKYGLLHVFHSCKGEQR